MLQYEKDPPEQELQSPTTELAHADGVLPIGAEVSDSQLSMPHEVTLANTMVTHVRMLAAKRAATMELGHSADVLPNGEPDELLLSSSFLAKIAYSAACRDIKGPSSPSSNTVVGIAAVAYGNLPAHCAADPQMLRQIKLTAHLHAAHQDTRVDARVSQLTAENLLLSYAYSEADVVMRAVLGLNRTQEAEGGSIKDGVKSGGVAFTAVLAAKTHYDLALSLDAIDGSEGTEELIHKRAERDSKLAIVYELLRESESFDSGAARWLIHRIFSSTPVKLNQYLHRFGSKPTMD